MCAVRRHVRGRRFQSRLMTTDTTRWRGTLLAPALAVYALLAFLPIANLIAMSLHVIKWDQGVAHWTFNGLAHYATMPADPLLRAGTLNTLIFAMLSVAAEMA